MNYHLNQFFNEITFIWKYREQIRHIFSNIRYKSVNAKRKNYSWGFWPLLLTHKLRGRLSRVLVCPAAGFVAILTRFKLMDEQKDWLLVFSNPDLEVWEHCSVRKNICFELTELEKKLLLSLARKAALGKSLLSGSNSLDFVNKWQSELGLNDLVIKKLANNATVDVSVWVAGKIRGSQVTENKPCHLAVIESVLRAIEDSRFKPLSDDELKSMQIEITLMSDVLVPLSKHEIENNEIDTNKAYLGVAVSNSSDKGWYIPATFNCRIFLNLNHLLGSLRSEKIDNLDTKYFYCEVTDFMEGESETVINLFASVSVNSAKNISLIERVEIAIYPLLELQESDGSFPAITSPFTLDKYPPHFVRSAYLVFALAQVNSLFLEYKNRERCVGAVAKGFSYLGNYLYTHKTMSDKIRCASLLEYNKTASLLQNNSEVARSHEVIMSLLPRLSYEPLLYIRLAYYLAKNGTGTEVALFKSFVDLIRADYFSSIKKPNTKIDVATFADLPNLLVLYGQLTKDNQYEKESREALEWLLSQQLANGSFRISSGAHYTYTRGTAKIAEALATNNLTRNTKAVEEAINWLHTMQYTSKNSYLVLPELRTKISGSFRHDYQNAATWIDASAHYLLALCALKED